MKTHVKRRLVGGVIYIVMLTAIGHFNITGVPVILMGLVFPILYEMLYVRPSKDG